MTELSTEGSAPSANGIRVGDPVRVLDVPAWVPDGLPEENASFIVLLPGRTVEVDDQTWDGHATVRANDPSRDTVHFVRLPLTALEVVPNSVPVEPNGGHA